MSDSVLPGLEVAPALPRSRRRLRDLPLEGKFGLLLAICGGLTALFASAAVLYIGWRSGEASAREQAHEVARLSAHSLQAAVAFEDVSGIRDSLAVAATRNNLRGIWVWSRDGRLLESRGDGDAAPPNAGRGGLAQGLIEASEPIPGEGGAAGHVTVRLDLSTHRSRLFEQGGAVLLGALVAVMLSLALSHRLARRIVRPIVALADAAGSIAAGRDFNRRLPAADDDELGRAVGAFNAMIDEVALRGEALADANRQLEARVAERTAALEREKERAEAASLAKTRFLANMSHELRTPLNGVIGAAQLLRDQGDEPQRRHELIGIIRSSGNNLLGLVASVLDLARIESGSLTLSEEDFNLADLVEAVVATAAVGARRKGLPVVCEIDPGLPLWRHGDAQRLRQVLLNLLGNAIKFTLHGEVVLRVVAAADTNVCFVVRDTGIGISASSLATVFEPFRQADDGSNRRFGGSGLGLTICRELVSLMGGRIDAASQLQRGSTFTVTLPLSRRADPWPVLPLAHRVAYIEPHEASARALDALLVRIGCEALHCRTVDEVRAALSQLDAQGRPAWLLVAADDASSLELMEAAAAHIDPHQVISMDPAEWYAADAARDGQRLARSVSKPVLRAALVSRFGAAQGALASQPRPLAADALTATALAQCAGRVLVVEDDAVNQTIVASMLTQAGFSVEVACDGYSALRAFGAMRFDLVLMDWQMPDMDGLEVTRRLRAGAAGGRGPSTPIVALTANAFAEDRAACLAAGMNDFLTKPVLADQLVRTVNHWIVAASSARGAA